MFIAILQGTPAWVWIVFAALLALGLAQTRERTRSLRQVVLLPLGMSVFAMVGNASLFQTSPWTWVLWLAAATVTATWFATGDVPAGQHYDPRTRRVHLPGSWEPLVLMMAIFGVRYAVAVALALHPQAHDDLAVGAIVASLYGALGGIFIGRMLRTLLAARCPGRPVATAHFTAWG